jgi:nicotinate-nucleotide pyrophosphorylase (carboxylating)
MKQHAGDDHLAQEIDRILTNALHEDAGNGDITSNSLIPENDTSKASIVAKDNFVVAGISFAKRVFQLADKGMKFRIIKKDGSFIKAGTVMAELHGNTRGILVAERTALNLLQRLSGIATLTDQYVKAVRGLNARIIDTRKTAPGLRLFDKYAVRAGGGTNHRFGLFDGVLIKDNHIAVAGGINRAVKAARTSVHHIFKIEIEVKNISELKAAMSAGADIIMLDNMPVNKMKKAVEYARNNDSKVLIEASGNVSLENVRKIAETGVDLISVGALTHSARAADLSLKINSF